MALVDQLVSMFGSEYVLDDAATLDKYSRDESFALPIKPRAVVRPQNTEEVQKLIRWANQTGTPLVPVSSGPPRFRGDTVPGEGGTVIVDLGRMKRVIRVDRRNRVVIVEPGITFGEIQPLLAREDLRLTTPLLPRRNKSVISSLLEREPTIIPKYQWVILEPLRCLEVVWGNGEVFRTGEAGEHGPLEEQWKAKLAQLIAPGPGLVDYYRLISAAQGSMGIATWASIKCEVLPKIHKLLFIPAKRLEDLIDCAYRLLRLRLGDELFILNNVNLANIIGEGNDQVTKLKEELPQWSIVVGVAGRDLLPEERVTFQEKDIMYTAQQYGCQLVSALPGVRGEHLLEVILNPSREPYWKLSYKGGCQDIFFVTTLDKTAGFLETMYRTAEEMKYCSSDIGVYIQPLHQGVSCHCEFNLPFDPGDQGETLRVKELLNSASEALLQEGAFFSRPYGPWAEMAYGRDAQASNLLNKLKGVFDPNRVMNPGKLCF